MAQATKSYYYQELKRAGVPFEKHYRDYTTEQLVEMWRALPSTEKGQPLADPTPEAQPLVPPRDHSEEDSSLRSELRALAGVVERLARVVAEDRSTPAAPAAPKHTPLQLDPTQHAGVTLNSHPGDEILEVDEFGNRWLQREVTKPAYPKPRARRVLKYDDPGVERQEIKVGEYVESFEVAKTGGQTTPSEIKITLPSYQTGIYWAPNMPFRIHTYQGNRGFNLEDVQRFYGGGDLVPGTIKRCYVSTDLCYDIATTIRAINTEFNERVLKKERA